MFIKDHMYRVGAAVVTGSTLLREVGLQEIDNMWGDYIHHYEWCPCTPAVSINYDDPFYVEGLDETPPF